MLVLSRKAGESIFIGDDIQIVVIRIEQNSVRIAVSAPPVIPIFREELYRQVLSGRSSADSDKNASEADKAPQR